MKHRVLPICGAIAAAFAVILNLAEGAPADQRTLAIEAVVAAIIAIAVAIVCLRRGGGWRWFALGIGGPALFVLADAGLRLALFLK